MNKNILIGLFLFVVINYSKPSGLNCGLWIVSFWFFVIFPFKFKRERQRQRDGDRERQRETEDIVLSCLLLSLFFFLDPQLSLNMEVTNGQGWLTNKSPSPSCLCLLALGLQAWVATTSITHECWGSKLRVSWLYSKHFTYWAPSQSSRTWFSFIRTVFIF